jgi:zinc protease
MLQDASFPPEEFAELKREYLTALQAQLDSPEELSSDALNSHFNSYPPGDPRYYSGLAERIEQVRKTTLDEVVAYHRELIGTARGQIAIVGDFDELAIEEEIARLFPSRVSGSPYARVDREFRRIAPQRMVIDTPDKENAFLRARLDINLRDDDPDAAAFAGGEYHFRRPLRTVEPAAGPPAPEGGFQLQCHVLTGHGQSPAAGELDGRGHGGAPECRPRRTGLPGGTAARKA